MLRLISQLVGLWESLTCYLGRRSLLFHDGDKELAIYRLEEEEERGWLATEARSQAQQLELQGDGAAVAGGELPPALLPPPTLVHK